MYDEAYATQEAHMLVNELNVALKVSSTEPLLRSALSGIRFRPSPNNTASVTVANPEHFYSLNELEYQVTPITLSVPPKIDPSCIFLLHHFVAQQGCDKIRLLACRTWI
jgi:hypothetical protein